MVESSRLNEIKQELDLLDSNIKTLESLIKDYLVCMKTETWSDTIISSELQIQDTRGALIGIISRISLGGE